MNGPTTFKSMVQLVLIAALLPIAAGAASHGDMLGEGLIIRIHHRGLVFIDIGESDGVMKGDLFNIVSSEVLAHPLTGDTLAVTPKNIGAIQVHQVQSKMSVAKLLHVMPGEDVMLKPIARVSDPERLSEIEYHVKHQMFKALGLDVPKRVAVIPGIYQMRMGEKRKGWALLAGQAVSLAAAIGYRASSNDWLEQYENLPAGLAQAEYDRYFNTADDKRGRSNRLLWLAGAIYAYNWADVLWLGGGAKMIRSQAQSSHTQVGLGLAADGEPLFQVVHRF